MTKVEPRSGSAERWGPLWGARADDWALNEDQQIPTTRRRSRGSGSRPARPSSTSGAAPGRSSISSRAAVRGSSGSTPPTR
jgi:hypothetical protein